MSFLNKFQRVLEPFPVRGKGRLAVAVLSRLGKREVQCHPIRGVTVFLEADKWIEQLMWAGAYERQLVRLFKKAVLPGMTVLDLGANIGYFSVLAAGLVGKSGHVHAFEPEPSLFGRLKKNLAAFPWAQAHPLAVGDRSGTSPFYHTRKTDETGWGSLLRGRDNPSTEETVVPVTTIDDWLDAQPIRPVDFLKIDIEGGEYRALKGAHKMIYQYRPVVVAELNEACLRRDGKTPSDVLTLLRSARYKTFSLTEELQQYPWKGWNASSASLKKCTVSSIKSILDQHESILLVANA